MPTLEEQLTFASIINDNLTSMQHRLLSADAPSYIYVPQARKDDNCYIEHSASEGSDNESSITTTSSELYGVNVGSSPGLPTPMSLTTIASSDNDTGKSMFNLYAALKMTHKGRYPFIAMLSYIRKYMQGSHKQ